MNILNKYIDGDREIINYTKDGVTISHTIESLITDTGNNNPISLFSTEERLTNIENTLDLILLKQEGIL